MIPRRPTHDPHDTHCPACARAGILKDLTVGRGPVRVALACRACGCDWTVNRGLAAPNWNAQVMGRG